MNHYVCFPSADPARGKDCCSAWLAKGYKLCVFASERWSAQDKAEFAGVFPRDPVFPGYYRIINQICAKAFEFGADLVTCIGDDMTPPEQGADIHSKLYFARFPNGDGVMQCTGDRQGQIIDGKVNSERICGSPTFGPAWAKRAFQGHGPFGDYGFRSFYADELIKDVAEKLGVLYQEPALKIDHLHWSFRRSKREWWHRAAKKNWDLDSWLFRKLKEDGFPGHEPLGGS